MHPQEFKNLPMLLIYIFMIPSMNLLLFIYSIFNMNVVSWGTREAPKTTEEIKEKQAEAAKKEESKNRKSFFGSLFGKDKISSEFVKNFFKSKVIFIKKGFNI